MFWLMNTDYRKLRQPRVIFTALSVTLVLLIAVFFLDRSHATHRWIRLGPLSLQPSELAKLVVIFYLAWFLEIRREPRGVGREQPDSARSLPALGTVLLVVGAGCAGAGYGHGLHDFASSPFVMLFVAGLSLSLRRRQPRWRPLPLIYLLIVRVPYRLRARARRSSRPAPIRRATAFNCCNR